MQPFEGSKLLPGGHEGMTASWTPSPDLRIEPPDTSREDMHERVSRLLEDEATIGTCFRLANGIIITARHCISATDMVRQPLSSRPVVIAPPNQ